MTPEMTLDIEPIKARAESATPGPWYHQQTFSGQHFVGAGPSDAPTPLALMHGSFAEQSRNAAFVTAARTDIPELIAEVERLRAELAEREAADEVARRGHRGVGGVSEKERYIMICRLDPPRGPARLDTKQEWDQISNPQPSDFKRADIFLANDFNEYVEWKNCGVVYRFVRREDLAKYPGSREG